MAPKKKKKTKEEIEAERKRAEEEARLLEEGGCPHKDAVTQPPARRLTGR